jgi:hypothetical protein
MGCVTFRSPCTITNTSTSFPRCFPSLCIYLFIYSEACIIVFFYETVQNMNCRANQENLIPFGVFWVAPCGLLAVHFLFIQLSSLFPWKIPAHSATCRPHLMALISLPQSLTMEAVCSFETLVHSQKTTRRNKPDRKWRLQILHIFVAMSCCPTTAADLLEIFDN